jgi:hypothetical protein
VKIRPQTTEKDAIIVTHAERHAICEGLRKVLSVPACANGEPDALFELYRVTREVSW